MKTEASQAAALLAGDERALARAISGLEAAEGGAHMLLRELRRRGRQARVVGVTGPPGAGKSTLVDALVAAERAAGARVAVVAVDPSSPFSGGAILGDRIRMSRWYGDAQVFVRSMAARGQAGGLAASTLQVVALLEGVGFDPVIVETVGVGQSEVDVAAAVDSTVVVLTPGYGDGVQAVKAGVMEIGDLFVVNKADQAGADRALRDVRDALALAAPAADAWSPEVLATVAPRGEGVADLVAALARHRRFLESSGRLQGLRRERVRSEVRALLAEAARRALARVDDALLDAVVLGERSADAVARDLVAAAARDSA